MLVVLCVVRPVARDNICGHLAAGRALRHESVKEEKTRWAPSQSSSQITDVIPR